MLDISSEKTSAISFSEMPCLQYVWHPGLLPAWIIAFFLPVNIPVISIGCSVSSTFLWQIILCCCCVPLPGCYVSAQRQLPIYSETGHKALTAQGRIQPAVMPAGVKDVIFKPLLWDPEAEKFRRHDHMIRYRSILLRWEFHFQRSLETIDIQAGNKKYWHNEMPGRCSFIVPRAGLDGAYLVLQMDRSTLESALGHGQDCLLQGFPEGNFQ